MIHLYASFFEKRESDPGSQTKRAPGSLIGRKMLEKGLRELYGVAYSEEILDKGKNGKPFLKEYRDIHFNISHTDGLAVCAFSDEPVGVDVEAVRPIRDPLVRRVLHEEEQEVLNRYRDGVKTENGKEVSVFSNPENEKKYDTVFFRYWTLKESCLKWVGCGLTREPREYLFALDPEDWNSPVYSSDRKAVCRQQMIRRGPDVFILSVCTTADEKPPEWKWENSI